MIPQDSGDDNEKEEQADADAVRALNSLSRHPPPKSAPQPTRSASRRPARKVAPKSAPVGSKTKALRQNNENESPIDNKQPVRRRRLTS